VLISRSRVTHAEELRKLLIRVCNPLRFHTTSSVKRDRDAQCNMPKSPRKTYLSGSVRQVIQRELHSYNGHERQYGRHRGGGNDLLYIIPTRFILSILRCGQTGFPFVSNTWASQSSGFLRLLTPGGQIFDVNIIRQCATQGVAMVHSPLYRRLQTSSSQTRTGRLDLPSWSHPIVSNGPFCPPVVAY